MPSAPARSVVCCASISGLPPAWARRSPCSTRAGAATSGARMSSSASSRPTAGRAPPSRSGISRSPRGAPSSTGTRRSRRWTSMPSGGVDRSWRSLTSSPTATCRGLGTRSAGRTSKSCSMPASTSSRRSTSSTSSRSTMSSSGSPGSSNGRRCPIGSSARPIRSSSSTWRPRRCVGAWLTATSTPPTRSTRRSATTSVRATCRRCASWPCCGSPIGSTTRWPSTASVTASPSRGRHGSASSSPCPARRPASS